MKTYLSYEELVERMKSVKLIATDVDGVLTDDTIYFGPDGLELKRFHVSDGFYMALAMRTELELVVISGRPSEATTTRMNDLGVKHVLQAPINKAELIKPTLEKLGIDYADIAFIGNEILDFPLLRVAGLKMAVLDAAPQVLDEVDYVTASPGGRGALR
ncbi:HAD hydrolase family protein, partial [Gemmatimonas aurantiaca]|nr:HAD hydrolase family protein [Gemmatimonas aurantiaca]